MSAGAAFGQAWVRFLTNPWPWVGFVAVAFLATVAGSFVPFVGFLVTFAISVFFTPMLARAAYLDATTGRIGFSSFFDFARIGPAIGVAMLVLLGTLVGTLLLVLPGIVFGLAVTFAQPAVAHGRKPIEAIVDSVRIATSNFGQFSIAFLIQLGLSFVGLATFGLGFFAILPLTTLFTTAFYRQAVGY
ncbi:hypothetical protein DW322_10315 [Rhodococcus rhodnii]|uniref:Uncharacterized protein n=1 Tax=Rhodococcus rhodnii TaxID=38312 RepID=A0A6P2CDB5_9NOCA|nr:hypothetical protein DW322_10315 [Rhodococcus rhodnii]